MEAGIVEQEIEECLITFKKGKKQEALKFIHPTLSGSQQFNQDQLTDPVQSIWSQVATHVPELMMISVPVTNILENIIKDDKMINTTFIAEMQVKPRQNFDDGSEIQQRTKSPWHVSKSIFSPYRLDSEQTNIKCFKLDWENCSIKKLVKDRDDRSNVKKFLQDHYQSIRECYKYYAGVAPFKNVPAIGTNVMTEIC